MAIGIAIALSAVAFVLALWPAVADAPWEPTNPTIVEVDEPQLVSESADALKIRCETRLKYVRRDVFGNVVQSDLVFIEFMRLGCLDVVDLK